MSRSWNELVATLADRVAGGVPMLAFLSVLAAGVVSLALYFWPHWLPWRWRLRRHSGRSAGTTAGRRGRRWRTRIGALRWRFRWRRRRRQRGRPAAEPLPADELPDLPAEVLVLSADELAAAGRYAEAVRERLRAIVRELVERAVIGHVPGWTVTELAGAASSARPELSGPLSAPSGIFSEIWYGQRVATRADDLAMRAHAQTVRRVLAEPLAGEPVTATPAPSPGGPP